ncbi:FAD:protein FMN transferase [Thalassobius sp. I31.1]|uniref:FAD:protein FMN transferase n=1 Tax=Thalassobius sp. I31.1 TaxID=2109912 RepID=UPI000D1A9907|nr:FAD:protein FMN transferase [Thalassobius sp. I31.1]
MTDSMNLTRRTILFAPLALAACRNGGEVLSFNGQTMGTSYSITAVTGSATAGREELVAGIDQALAAVHAEMSNWDSQSEVSLFNASASTNSQTVSPAFAQVMNSAEEVRRLSGGKFDVTLGPLIEAWGFGATDQTGTQPSDAVIASLMAGVGAGVEVDGNAIRKNNAETQVYLSSIAKGHGVDRVAQALNELGVKDYMVEIGGDLVTAGVNPEGQPWQVGIEKPDVLALGVQSIVGISGMGLATSGDYRNFFEVDGQRFSHILDGETGRPVDHATASATVVAENAMMADAWSTAMLTLGREEGLKLAEELNLAVMFIERDASGDTFATTASAQFAALQA